MNDQATPNQVAADRASVGKFLYRFAWAFEIFAVALGLGIALVTLYAGFETISKGSVEVTLAEKLNVIIAAVPFFMVAMVEATKIPLVVTFYKTTKRAWKYFFGFCVLLAALITFETAFNGLERAFHTLVSSIDRPKKELVGIDQKLDQIGVERTRLESLTIESIEEEYDSRYNSELTKLGEQKQPLQEQINALRASVRTEVIESVESSLASTMEERDRLLSARDTELSKKAEEFRNRTEELAAEIQTQRQSLQAQLRTESAKLDKTRRDAEVAISKAFIIGRDAVRKDWNARISKQEEIVERIRARLNGTSSNSNRLAATTEEQQALASIRDEYANRIERVDQRIQKLRDEIKQSLGSKESEINNSVDSLLAQIQKMDEAFQAKVDSYQQSRERSYNQLEKQTQEIEALDAESSELVDRRIELSDVINREVGNNQIYRMAMWWSGQESAAEVAKDTVAIVALIWFGSLAALVALMGVVLALASLVIQDPRIKDHKQASTPSALAKLLQTIRRQKVDQRKSLRRKKEIVEVDRVVFKEVPVEVVKKEYVHVPFYTNDEDLLNISQPNRKDGQADD